MQQFLWLSKYALGIIGAFAFMSIANASPYPNAIAASFLESCGTKNQPYCECFLKKTEQTVPVEKFIADIHGQKEKFMWEHPYLDIGLNCVEKITISELLASIAKK